jgi:signal transduction histidine kinase
VNKYRDELFSTSPIIFLAQTPLAQRLPNSTGFVSQADLTKTLDLALTLQPKTEKVYVVTGASARDKFYEHLARDQLQKFLPRVALIYLSGMRAADLEHQLAALPDQAIIYYVIMYQDAAGENFHPLEYLNRISSVANRPIYSWTESTMNRGIVGGSLRSQASEIDALAELALRVLHGTPADSISISNPDFSANEVDWRQLQRWSISEPRVPAGTRILFREPTMWNRYKAYIVWALLLLLVQSVLIVALLIQSTRRRKAEKQLQNTHKELQKSYDRIRELGGQLLKAHETERARLGRELHDGIGQQLSILVSRLQLLEDSPESFDGDGLVEEAQEIAANVRSLSHQLHPAKLRIAGLVASIAALQDQYPSIVISFAHENVPEKLPDDIALSLFRIVQEALQNAVKHGRARNVKIELKQQNGELSLHFSDDGSGFETLSTDKGGLGVMSMQERVELFGGTFQIASSPPSGTFLKVTVPLPAV